MFNIRDSSSRLLSPHSIDRYSLPGGWHRTTETSSTKVNAYIIGWQLELFSNVTYFLADPVNGETFTSPSHTWQMP